MGIYLPFQLTHGVKIWGRKKKELGEFSVLAR
jgi:hypothetical protein